MQQSFLHTFQIISINIASAAYIAIIITSIAEHNYSITDLQSLHLVGLSFTLVSVAFQYILATLKRKEHLYGS